MSFCPTDDIHSLYLDNEMPQIYKEEYEEHVKSCSACQAKLNKMKKLHSLFSQDSNALNVDSHYMDQSFERLKLKMKYSKNTNASRKAQSSFKSKYFIPSLTAAAAALLVAIIMPSSKNSDYSTASVSQALVSQLPTAKDVSLGSGRSVVISGNIHDTVLPVVDDNSSMIINASDNSSAVRTKDLITHYEVFSPDLGNNKNISIKITIPGVNSKPVSTEIELPLDVIVGQY